MTEVRVGDKLAMARYCVAHDFLTLPGRNSETEPRITAATILVNSGTTPDTVVGAALEWMRNNWDRGPFNVRWYTPGSLVQGRLLQFRNRYQEYRSAAILFVFPGEVDPDVESVIGNDPIEFATMHLRTRFTYSILSAYRFDLQTGDAFFHYRAEVAVQGMCAGLKADHKFLFLDPGKLQSISGEPAYNIRDLLKSSQTVTIYTVTSKLDEQIKNQFNALRERALKDIRENAPKDTPHSANEFTVDKLRLCIVSDNGEQLFESPSPVLATGRLPSRRNS